MPVILEAAIYAMTLGALITLVLDKLLGLGIDKDSLISALGAGVIVFPGKTPDDAVIQLSVLDAEGDPGTAPRPFAPV